MIRGTVCDKWERVNPSEYSPTEAEDKIINSVINLNKKLKEQTETIKGEIVNYQDSCEHKVFKEFEEDGTNTWLGKEIKEHWRCVICDAEFLGYYYRLSIGG